MNNVLQYYVLFMLAREFYAIISRRPCENLKGVDATS
jgi:hypothetical protein